MAKRIQKVNVKNAIEKRTQFLNDTLLNISLVNAIHISIGNSKMGPIPSFSVLPFLTCTNCKGCSGYCYAAKGNFNFPRNINALAENTALLMKNPAFVEHEINKFLNQGTIIYKYFRFNVAGDIGGKVEENYFPMILRISKKNPWTRFLMFTKNYRLVNEYIENGGQIPENLQIVFSKWDNIPIDNPHNLPIAIVKVNENTAIPDGAFHCSGDCANCLKCWLIEAGKIVYFDLH